MKKRKFFIMWNDGRARAVEVTIAELKAIARQTGATAKQCGQLVKMLKAGKGWTHTKVAFWSEEIDT